MATDATAIGRTGRTDRPATTGRGLRRPATILRVEGSVVLVAAVVLYAQSGASWWLFAALLFVPDVGLLGYLRGPHLGSLTYNLTHTVVGPVTLGVVGSLFSADPAIAVALTWIAHIGMDRALGYGLKYPTAFHDTHLQRTA